MRSNSAGTPAVTTSTGMSGYCGAFIHRIPSSRYTQHGAALNMHYIRYCAGGVSCKPRHIESPLRRFVPIDDLASTRSALRSIRLTFTFSYGKISFSAMNERVKRRTMLKTTSTILLRSNLPSAELLSARFYFIIPATHDENIIVKYLMIENGTYLVCMELFIFRIPSRIIYIFVIYFMKKVTAYLDNAR